MINKPVIGLLGYLQKTENIFNYRYNMVNEAYISALMNAGAVPIYIPSFDDDESLRGLIESVDGLLIPGGADVDPVIYGEENKGLSRDTDIHEDTFQKKAIEFALEMGKPIMGICRGHQLLNALLGGKLIQDIPTEVEDAISHAEEKNATKGVHKVFIEKGTVLHSIMGRDEIVTNTLHHQAVKTPGKGMVVAGRTEDGIIEATENIERKIVSMQWHPEALKDFEGEAETSKRIFEYFISLIEK